MTLFPFAEEENLPAGGSVPCLTGIGGYDDLVRFTPFALVEQADSVPFLCEIQPPANVSARLLGQVPIILRMAFYIRVSNHARHVPDDPLEVEATRSNDLTRNSEGAYQRLELPHCCVALRMPLINEEFQIRQLRRW